MPDIELDPKAIGAVFKERRKTLKLTQTDVAEKLGVQKNQVSKVETGKQSMTMDTLYKFARVLQLNMDIKFILPSGVVEQYALNH